MALCTLLLALATGRADGPVAFGRRELDAALREAGLGDRKVEVVVAGSATPEEFRLRVADGAASVEGSDPNGALYGCLELAERVRMHGADALAGPEVRGEPFLRDRGLNVFLTLPWNCEKNEPDYDPAALADPARWWFHNEDYWRTLLDQMARSRLNWLDIHGSYDIHTTRFPNLYAYFVRSEKYPLVGIADELRQRNLAQLNHVIELAHARGVRVSLMSYEARFYTPHNPAPSYEETEEADYEYTREVVERMIRLVPGLDAIGFRIGESGHGGEFFRCYLEAVAASGRDIPLYTRSWVTRKAKVVPLAAASSDFTVEIKYNGEQWGPPYHVAGGRIANWYSYSFEDYLSDSGGFPKKLWPGNVTERGERWPAQPYKIVWQVRANGTHRIFPFYEPSWVRGTVRSMRLGTATGFAVEPMNAYFPASPDYYLADPATRYCNWIHERDRMYLMLWGRMGYDPDTPEDVFTFELQRHFGEGAGAIADAWKAASRVIPTAFTTWAFGPDHRDHAPELEWGGELENVLQFEPFDSHVFRTIREELAYRATGGRDGRMGLQHVFESLYVGETLHADLFQDRIARASAADRLWAKEIYTAWHMLAALGCWYSHRWMAAALLAIAEADPGMREATKAALESEARGAVDSWRALSSSSFARYYKPFTDRLRMRTNQYHWRNALEDVKKDAQRFAGNLGALPEELVTGGWSMEVPSAAALECGWREEDGQVVATLKSSESGMAWLLHKPLPSSTFFHKVSMKRVQSGDGDWNLYEARIPRSNHGHLVAFEGQVGNWIGRRPAWLPGPPYLVVPSRPGPTPLIYSSEEALAYLEPESLDPQKHGLLLVAQRAWNFHRSFPVEVQRKLLDAVERGMTLLVMQQDYTSGRYPLDWLPVKPRVENFNSAEFDPAGALGLEKIETADILWQRFLPAPGWDVFGNGGVAHLAHGQGHVWMIQARLMQRMHVPAAARAMLKLLELGGREKPVIVVDAGSEGARYSTSVYPDFMNAHDIPFLTLGEVIAEEQGMDSATPVPGRAWEDRLLEGRGPQMMKAWLEERVRAAAARPLPRTREEQEARKTEGRRELLRGLGLDPMPERTPLNARVTGVLRRDGYRIEKLAFESRPGFWVTARLCVPDGEPPFPVIVNPHGHWGHKSLEPVVQARLIAQALHGYLAMVVDSPGTSFEGDRPVERRQQGQHNDWRLTLDTCATGFYVWDLMRALDYLETRPEADLQRVGITGASGGGLATVYAFAADERFHCAVPVVYATSLEVNPHNGCLCNHVPGTLRVGDRSDVLALRAPAPVLLIGASDDPEFPPDGLQRTAEKMERIWGLYGGGEKVRWQVFEGPHDYSKAMREAALGFFDLHLRGRGDGSPVPEPEIVTEPPDSAEMRVLVEWPAGSRTMADVVRERLRAGERASSVAVPALDGAPPAVREPQIREQALGGGRRALIFSTPEGIELPAVLRLPRGEGRGVVVLVSDNGKEAAARELDVPALTEAGFACLCLDVRGLGELGGLDQRLATYLGVAPALWMAWDLRHALEMWLGPHPGPVAVIGRGPAAAQAALFAALLLPQRLSFVAGLDGLRGYEQIFEGDLTPLAIQPRAVSGATLDELRRQVQVPAMWGFRGAPEPDWRAALERASAR